MPYKAFIHYCHDCGSITRSESVTLLYCRECLGENTEVIDEEDYEDED